MISFQKSSECLVLETVATILITQTHFAKTHCEICSMDILPDLKIKFLINFAIHTVQRITSYFLNKLKIIANQMNYLMKLLKRIIH